MQDAYTILVTGSRNVDAGKTTFATGLVSHVDGIGVKPRAGNDYWYDYDTVGPTLSEGRLVGKDAKRLAAVSSGSIDAEELNPLHRLWRPIRSGSGDIFGREGSEFLVDRVGSEFVLNGVVDLPDAVLDGLPLSDARSVESLEEINQLMESRHRPALRSVTSLLSEYDRVVVESYADVARPIRDVDVDAVAVVGGGSVEVYDGDRFCRAATVASGSPSMGRLEERVSDVTDLLEPEGRDSLPPMVSTERSDPETVASRYENAYRDLLEIAE